MQAEEYKHYEKEIKGELFKKTIIKLSQKYNHKKVLFYGTGVYFDIVADNYDLKNLFNVVGVSDLKFETAEDKKYKTFVVIKPSELKKNNIDIILVTAANFMIISNALMKLGIAMEHFAISKEDRILETQKNYQTVLQCIKNKNKIKVAFLVNETAKWQYQSLYHKMERDPYFEPLVLATLPLSAHKNTGGTQEKLEDICNFFEKFNINVEFAYNEKEKSYLDLKQFEPDMIFYQQPWDLSTTQDISETSKFALTFYCPYAISESSFVFKWTEIFCKSLYKHFVVDKSAQDQYIKNFGVLDNIEVVGHPKLDAISEIVQNYNKKSDKKTIIYAPHHSFEPDSLRWGTFKWSGPEVLKIAQQNPQFNWVMKPHPHLINKLIENNIKSKKEVDRYYNDWEKIGTVFEGGNYFELFTESDLMITDCGSFIVEYLITQKPLIHLLNIEAQEQSTLNQQILKCYYSAKNAQELKLEFEKIMIKKLDVLKHKRINKLEKLNFENSTTNITEYLKNI